MVPLSIAAWAVVEIWLLVLVAQATSGLVVLLILVAGFVLGAAAVKRAGRSAWRNLTASVAAQQQGTPPVAPDKDGRNGLAMLGGLLLMVPGLLSDAAALLLLAPPTRRLAGRLVDRAMRRRGVPVDAFPPRGPGDPRQGGPFPGGPFPGGNPGGPSSGGGKVIQGEVVDRDRP